MPTSPLVEAMPPTLSLQSSSGRPLYVLRLNGDGTREDEEAVRVPFMWKIGPPGLSGLATLRFTTGAASVLIRMPGALRWRWIHTILEAKYAKPDAAFEADGGLAISEDDLRATVGSQ